MKYFTYKLIAAANGWNGESPRAEKRATILFEQACKDYQRQLTRVRRRISAPAWQFFRYGVMDESLHDATLLSFTIGDDIRGKRPRSYLWHRNSARTRARLEFLNCRGDLKRVFECVDTRRLRTDLLTGELPSKSLGDLYSYELRPIDRQYLALSFLFATGAEIEIEFRKLQFRTQRGPAAGRQAEERTLILPNP